MPKTTNGETHQRIIAKLARLYGREQAISIAGELFALLHHAEAPSSQPLQLSEKDVVLITYGDQVFSVAEPPLATLYAFLKDKLYPVVNGVHILPFYPYSSDDGFSVIDYHAVDSELGEWEHIRKFGIDFRLMFDAVLNHISAGSAWFQMFLRGETPYDDYFITVEPETDLSQVVRPRALPLLTPFQTASGEKFVWTTFSPDQVDLKYANPQVLLDAIRVMLFYVQQGASLIRLDAIAFLWKKIGTLCIHLEETHLIIQIMRDVLNIVAPSVVLVTETNVPHEENISYFGDGSNEAQMVYQFPLPPLILHTLQSGDAGPLSKWASTLERVSDHTTFFNFTASHDGIGLRPVIGILTQQEIDSLARLAEEHGGFVSYKSNSDGSQSPYELNINYFDAITNPDVTAGNPDVAVQRFMASQAIALSLLGVPGIYFHSIFGSRNYRAGVEETGRYRSINREKLDVERLRAELQDGQSIRAKVYSRYHTLLTARTQEPSFHPLGYQTVLNLSRAVFAIERTSPDGRHRVIALHNVRGVATTIEVPVNGAGELVDLLTGCRYDCSGSTLRLNLSPYQSVWLKLTACNTD